MAVAEALEIRHIQRTNHHSSVLFFQVYDFGFSNRIYVYSYHTGCSVHPTYWYLDTKFIKTEDEIVIKVMLTRTDNWEIPVCARIKLCAESNQGQSTETENVIRVFSKHDDSFLKMRFPHENASASDIILDVQVKLTISDCCIGF